MLSNNPEASLTYLRDFGTRYPDSVYANDATLAYAKALLATNRPAEAVQVLAHRRRRRRRGRIPAGQGVCAERTRPHWRRSAAARLLQLPDELSRPTWPRAT